MHLELASVTTIDWYADGPAVVRFLLFVAGSLVLVAHPGQKPGSLGELIAAAKAEGLIVGLAGFFVMRVFVNEVKPVVLKPAYLEAPDRRIPAG